MRLGRVGWTISKALGILEGRGRLLTKAVGEDLGCFLRFSREGKALHEVGSTDCRSAGTVLGRISIFKGCPRTGQEVVDSP